MSITSNSVLILLIDKMYIYLFLDKEAHTMHITKKTFTHFECWEAHLCQKNFTPESYQFSTVRPLEVKKLEEKVRKFYHLVMSHMHKLC